MVVIFQSYLSQKESLMATFSKTCTLTSRKYGPEPGMSIKNIPEKRQCFWSHSSDFALEK